MKKILLTGVIGIIGFISFSNATNIQCNDYGCTPESVVISSEFCDNGVPKNLPVGSIECSEGLCSFHFGNEEFGNSIEFNYENGSWEGYCEVYSEGDVLYGIERIGSMGDSFNGSIDFSAGGTIEPDEPGDLPSVVDSLLPGGSAALTPAVNGITSTVNEFIPYIVYIGIGLLSAVIGFVAIKWLMNRVRAKSLGVFSSRRKK